MADEVYHFLNYLDDPPPPMGTYCSKCPLISLGSFSKILAPGLRLGWMQVSPDLIKKITGPAFLLSGGGLNPFTSEIINSVISLGLLTAHIEKLKTGYSNRMEVFCDALRLHLPDPVEFKVPKGGYFVWVKLPKGIDTNAFRNEARKQNVDFHPGSLFSHKEGLENYLRLTFAFYDEDELVEGARRLGNVVSDHLS